MTMTTIMGPFDELSDDTLAQVMSFLDYESAVGFCKEICTPLTTRFQTDSFAHVWRSIYARHHFAPVERDVDYMHETNERRELVQNLVGSKAHDRFFYFFNLPHRFFYFVPITPSTEHDDDDDDIWNDPPPVNFDCNSFVLTSAGCSGEFVFLNPFDMSLSIHNHCTENADAMIRKAMTDAACAVVRGQSHQNEEREEHIVGAIIDETVYRNHNVQDYRTPPSQVLIDSQDYFNVNLAEYFLFTEDRHARRRTPQGGLLLHPDDEVDFGYIGIEAKPIVGKNGQLEGSMVGLARFLCSLRVDGVTQEENISCTEIVTWRKLKGESLYGDVRICRVPWDIFCADTSAKHNRMYVVYYRGQGPLVPRVTDDHVMDDTDSTSPMGRRTIFAHPLMPANDTVAPSSPRYFSNPEFSITCSDFVSYVTVDCTGTLLIGTSNGTVEVWKPDAQSGPTRVAVVNSKEATAASAKRFKAESEALSVADDGMEDSGSSGSMPTSGSSWRAASSESLRLSFAVVENDEAFPRILGLPTVESLHFPDHLPIEECGFVSLQHSRFKGTSLLLWKMVGTNVGTDFQVVSQINLPLSPHRKPRIHYDGRRILVLGEDHIGVIILVYHVFSSTEDIDYFPSNPCKKLGDESGGLYNYTIQPHVRFANRIRHAALGGLERYEGMYMTCNERFLIVNTKTGHLLGGGSSPTDEGLLIIDLKEHE